jgi:Domain of unknown function (DUF6883)
VAADGRRHAAARRVGVRIEQKLAAYCLNLRREVGVAKARGFAKMLGITVADIDYLVGVVRARVMDAPVTGVRDNRQLFGMLWEVRLRVAGLREVGDRLGEATTT